MNTVINLYNLSYEKIFEIDWKKAVCLFMSGKATSYSTEEYIDIKTASGIFKLPYNINDLSDRTKTACGVLGDRWPLNPCPVMTDTVRPEYCMSVVRNGCMSLGCQKSLNIDRRVRINLIRVITSIESDWQLTCSATGTPTTVLGVTPKSITGHVYFGLYSRAPILCRSCSH